MFISVWWAHRLQLEFWTNQGLGSAWGRKLHHRGKRCDVFCQCDGLVHFAQPHWVGLNHHIWLESQAALDRQQCALLQTFVRVFCWGRELKLWGVLFVYLLVCVCVCVYCMHMICVCLLCVCACMCVCLGLGEGWRGGGGRREWEREKTGKQRKLNRDHSQTIFRDAHLQLKIK